MLSTIRTVALSALVGLGAIASVPAIAHADGVYLNLDNRGDQRFGVYTGETVRDRHHDRDRYDDRDWRRSCSARDALNKARRMGLHRARVVDEGRRTIKVSGRKFNERVVVVFGRREGCPVVYR